MATPILALPVRFIAGKQSSGLRLAFPGGIQPATYVPILNEEFTKDFDTPVPANLNDLSTKKHVNLPFNKTMHLRQQGFTANVTCRNRNPQDNSTYTPVLHIQSIADGLSIVQLTAQCPNITPGQAASGQLLALYPRR
jgi:hypothetical protein